MKWSMKRVVWLAMLGCASLAGCTSPGLQVRDVGSFHVGGRAVTLSGLPERDVVLSPGAPPLKVNANGDFQVEGMYARYTRLTEPKARYPLMLWHGGGLSGVTWETKPDGQPGWENYFLAAGHDVYVSDAVERGRASWARFPEIFKGEPLFRTKKEAWEVFRIGPPGSYATEPTQRRQFDTSQFPGDAFDTFAKQGIPRWATNDVATQAAYDAYVERVCPCVIIVHSQGGNFAFSAALRHPDKIKAIVALETSGSPDPATTDFSRIAAVPMLWIWGDNLDLYAYWRDTRARQESFRAGLLAAGGVADEIVLPERGMRGNSHMMMMDRNSDRIAGIVQDWLTRRGLMK